VLSIGTTVMNVADLRRAAAFWQAALGYVPRREPGEDWAPEGDDFLILVPPSGTGARLALNESDSPPPEVPHVHLDLYAGDAEDQAAEVERLIGLGASRVDWPWYDEDGDYVVLADPEGNLFCVIDTGRS
jgi:catechol 2,3-dioxygenase-like lactoylglutathione lyase family enzyme